MYYNSTYLGKFTTGSELGKIRDLSCLSYSNVLVVGGIPEVLPKLGPKTSEPKTPRTPVIDFLYPFCILFAPRILLV